MEARKDDQYGDEQMDLSQNFNRKKIASMKEDKYVE